MGNLMQDIKYALRMMMKSPGLIAAAILSLGLGIGANTAIFNVMNAVLLRPLPYTNPDRLIVVWEKPPDGDRGPVSAPNFLDWQSQSQLLEQVGAFAFQPFNITGGGDAERVSGSFVSASLFDVFNVKPVLGRTFSREEDQPGHAQVVVLSNSLWKRRFGADPGVIGQPLILNGKPLTIVGVMPPEFYMVKESSPGTFIIDDSEVWVPVSFIGDLVPGLLARRNTHFLRVIARLKPGVSMQQAQAEMDTIASKLAQQYPETNTDSGIDLVSLHEQLVGRVRTVLLILLGTVGLVLLIACANVGNLLLVRATARQKEVAIRMALGVTRGRLIRQFLTESIVLALIGGALGLLLAYIGIGPLIALNAINLPRIGETSIDGWVLGFTLTVSVLTGIIFGLAPALNAIKTDTNQMLKEEGKGSTSGSASQRLRSALVVAEVAIALVLLIGASLLIKSFARLQSVSPGYDPRNVLTMDISLPQAKFTEPAQSVTFYQQLLERVKALPGVQYAGLINDLPLKGSTSTTFAIFGEPDPPQGQEPRASYRIVSTDYFNAMGIPLKEGRAFTEQDREGSYRIAVVNETLARRHWPNESPIGKQLVLSNEQEDTENRITRVIVGMIGDVRHSGLETDPSAEVYVPFLQNPGLSMSLVVRSTSSSTSLISPVRREISVLDKDLPVADITTVEKLLSNSVASRRFNMLLLAISAGVALLLSVVGIYAVIAYSVNQRKQELGIRMALGARPSDVIKLILGQGTKLVLLGVIIGLIAAYALNNVISSLLYDISSTDIATFILIPLVLIAVTVAALYLPARKATQVDPIVALKGE